MYIPPSYLFLRLPLPSLSNYICLVSGDFIILFRRN
jgi:hypothetical protein